MHAVVLVGHGGPDRLVYRRDVPVPRPRAGEVLVEVRAAGVNNTDINTRVGWYAKSVSASPAAGLGARQPAPGTGGGWSGAIAFPRIQGADACGIIVAVGADVSEDRLGQRVIISGCLRSQARGGRAPWLGSEIDGAFAQFVRAPADDVFAVRCDLDDAQLGAVPCSYATAENLLHRAGVAAGDSVLVTGASGGVGSAAVSLAALRGAQVTAVAGSDKSGAVAALGAGRVVERSADLVAALGPDTIDAVIDIVGGATWPALLGVLRPGGRYAVAGAIAGPYVELDLRTLYLKDLTLLGCTMHAPDVFPNLVGFLERGELVPLVAATYPLEQIARAQADFETKRHVGKLVLLPPAVR